MHASALSTRETSLNVCCCCTTGKSSVRTRNSAKQYRQSGRRRRCSKRRPTSTTSPSCGSSGKSRQVPIDNKHAGPLQPAVLSVGLLHSSMVHWVLALQAFICSTDLQGVPDLDALTCVSCCGCICAVCIASKHVALPADALGAPKQYHNTFQSESVAAAAFRVWGFSA